MILNFFLNLEITFLSLEWEDQMEMEMGKDHEEGNMKRNSCKEGPKWVEEN